MNPVVNEEENDVEMVDVVINKPIILYGPPLLNPEHYKNEIYLGTDLRRYDSIQDSQGNYFWYCLDAYDYQFTEYLLPILNSINSNIGYFKSVMTLDPCLKLSSFPRSWWIKKPHSFLLEIVFDMGFNVTSNFLPKPTKMDCIDYFMDYPQYPGSASKAQQFFLKKYHVSRKRMTNYWLNKFDYDNLILVGNYFDVDLSKETCFRNALLKMQQHLDKSLQSMQ